jgi:hypothetical protein
MSDLVADRVDLALNKMETQFVQAAGGKTKAEAGVRELFNYCGRPLESELRHGETGFFLYADGRRAPMRGFYYSGKTTQNPKGVCFFAVRVVPGEKGMKVVSFGPLKLVSGQLPEWALRALCEISTHKFSKEGQNPLNASAQRSWLRS